MMVLWRSRSAPMGTVVVRYGNTMLRATCWLLLVGAVLAPFATAEAQTGYLEVRGQPGIHVEVANGPSGVIKSVAGGSGSAGGLYITQLPAGGYTVTFSMAGYAPSVRRLEIQAGRVLVEDVALEAAQPEATESSALKNATALSPLVGNIDLRCVPTGCRISLAGDHTAQKGWVTQSDLLTVKGLRQDHYVATLSSSALGPSGQIRVPLGLCAGATVHLTVNFMSAPNPTVSKVVDGHPYNVNAATPCATNATTSSSGPRPWLGVITQPTSYIPMSFRQEYAIPNDGVIVTGFDNAANPPAEVYGVALGSDFQSVQGQTLSVDADVITAIDGTRVRNPLQLKAIVDQHAPGDTVVLTVSHAKASSPVPPDAVDVRSDGPKRITYDLHVTLGGH